MRNRAVKALVLVDDDPALLNALTFAFETEGYEVRSFADAESLLGSPDELGAICLVVDQRLPGMSGLALLTELRARKIAAPAILITTNPAPSIQHAARAVGVEIVEKPLLDGLLSIRVREAIEREPLS